MVGIEQIFGQCSADRKDQREESKPRFHKEGTSS